MYLRLFIVCGLVMLLSSQIMAQISNQETVVLQEHSLSILGTSNVNDFQCIYKNESSPDTLNFNVEPKESMYEISGDQLSMYVESFDCGKKGINRDFRKTLKSNDYPTIDVSLERLIYELNTPVLAEVLISIAGESRLYQVDISDQTLDTNSSTIKGNQVVKLSDFNLSPPKALFGLVQVRDEMNINFTLSVKK